MKKELLEKLFSLRRFGIKPGLHRITKILNDVGNPEKKLKAVHIAGTNGKGSIASLLASVLFEAGYNVGLYTSPHIYSFNERIRINGKPIPDDILEPLVKKYLPYSEKFNATFFEITTAMAFEYFASSSTDICIIETGMGGRFDATNVIDPEISVIARIDFDHEEYLGKTLEEITYEKAGIIKPGKPAVISFNHEQVYNCIKKIIKNQTKLIFAEELGKVEIKRLKPNFMEIEIVTYNKCYNLRTNFIGKHQAENILTSIICLEHLSSGFHITEKAIVEGVANIKKNSGYYGRFELIPHQQPFIIDVGHNPNSISSVVELLINLYPNTKWNTICALMRDKNHKKILENLIPVTKSFIFPNLKYDRAIANAHLKEIAIKELNFSGSVFLFNSTEEALDFAIKLNQPTLVIGSFYLLSELVIPLKERLNWEFEIQGDKLTI